MTEISVPDRPALLPEGSIALAEFCETRSQREAANILGCTPGAVSQMIAAERRIYLFEAGDSWDHFEITRIRPKKAA